MNEMRSRCTQPAGCQSHARACPPQIAAQSLSFSLSSLSPPNCSGRTLTCLARDLLKRLSSFAEVACDLSSPPLPHPSPASHPSLPPLLIRVLQPRQPPRHLMQVESLQLIGSTSIKALLRIPTNLNNSQFIILSRANGVKFNSSSSRMQQQQHGGQRNDALGRSRIALKHLIFVMLPNALRSIVDLTLAYLGKSSPRDLLPLHFLTPNRPA